MPADVNYLFLYLSVVSSAATLGLPAAFLWATSSGSFLYANLFMKV